MFTRLCVFLLVFILMPVSLAFAETIILAADSWCPINCTEKDGVEGYAVDMAREIFESRGYTVEYKRMAWERAVSDAQEGYITGIIGADTVEGMGMVFPEEEIAISPFSFFVRKGYPWRYEYPASLLNHRVGVAAGYDLGGILARFVYEHESDMTLVEVHSEAPARKLLSQLVEERLDIIIDDGSVIRYEAAKMGLDDQIVFAGDDGDYAKLYIVFSSVNPKSHEYARIFSEGVRELRSSGQLDAILSRYGLQDWRKQYPSDSH